VADRFVLVGTSKRWSHLPPNEKERRRQWNEADRTVARTKGTKAFRNREMRLCVEAVYDTVYGGTSTS